MKNQFFYTIKHTVANGAPTRANDESIEQTFTASFNLDKVIRSMELPDGNLVVILDDFHTEMRQSVSKNPNGKDVLKVTPTTMQSEIMLNPIDKQRFIELTNVESWKLEKS